MGSLGKAKKHHRIDMKKINFQFIFTGILCLFVGIGFYYICRPSLQTYFIHYFGLSTGTLHFNCTRLGIIGSSFPSFIHVFSFTMIMVGLFPNWEQVYPYICLMWFIIDIGFELAQKYGAIISKIIPQSLDGVPFLENCRGYFYFGKYDISDLVSATLGSLTSYFILCIIKRRFTREKI